MSTKLELLAPAKNLQTGIAAIKHGADAVYIAADKFGAREKAGNSLEDIKTLVEFAHLYFARVYVTVNTILFDNEIAEVKKLIERLYDINVDAIIIQDFAILNMGIPPIAIHASTQMHNNTPEKIKFLESCGIERIVLPRELNISEIEILNNATTSELEFFIHGALCVCYSGQCYMSQEITGRSANKGACAQPCRSAYDLVDSDGKILVKNKHLLSLKDLNLSNHISQLIDAGITSFKIEGRMKDVSYVKNTVSFYSNLINKIISQKPEFERLSSGNCEYKFEPDLERSFNRGFTKHFVDGRILNQASYNSQKSVGKLIGKTVKVNKDFFSIETTEIVSNGDGLCYFNSKGEIRGFLVNRFIDGKIYPNQSQVDLTPGTLIYRNFDHAFDKTLNGETSKRTISTSINIDQNDSQLIFSIKDEDSISCNLIVNDTYDVARNPQMALNTIENQFRKTGDSVFSVSNINTSNISSPKHIPVSELNAIKRKLIEKLMDVRVLNYSLRKRPSTNHIISYPVSNIDFKANVSNAKSKDFLMNHGVEKIESAYEIEKPYGNSELMVTRYCIKYELEMCPSKQNGKSTKPLFLKDNNHKYPLIFDCQNCQMKIMSPTRKDN
ncbi:MAG: U32 family peptidase [Bacteroidales bacterium]|nr:MAG: U32 family peptidase [Bacteroidales bacterium]